MSACLKRNASMLKLLLHAKPPVVKSIMKTASPDLIKAISEICLNVLKGNVPLRPAHKTRLSRFKHHLRKLAKKNISWKKKKTILQKGGLLPLLIKAIAHNTQKGGILPALALPFIAGAAGGLLSRL